MANYRGVTEWGSKPEKDKPFDQEDWRKGEPLGLFDDPEACKRTGELISRAACTPVSAPAKAPRRLKPASLSIPTTADKK